VELPWRWQRGGREAGDLALDGISEVAFVHGGPELLDHGRELGRVVRAFGEKRRERFPRQKLDVLREHREQAAHEE